VELHVEQATQKSWSYRMALRLFEAAFAECENLSAAEQQLLMQEVGVRARQMMPKSDGTAEPARAVTVTGVSVKVEEKS
jgi:hypothetical protein